MDELYLEYVDYGTEDWVPASWVRRDVAFTHEPVQCYKFRVLPIYENVS